MLYNQVLVNTYSQKTLNQELINFYTAWKNRYIREVADTLPKQEYMFYTLDQTSDNNAVTCSEAMGYGLFIFPMMSVFDKDAKDHFQALYHFVKAYPSFYNLNLMAWQQIETEEGEIVNSTSTTSSATDGDIDISYGMLLAHQLWEHEDHLPYLVDAKLRIQALMESCVSHTDYILLLGDWVSGIEQNNFKYVTRSSDFISYMLKVFMKVDSKNKVYWQYVLRRMASIIQHQLKQQSKYNGLMPDFFIKEGRFYVPPTTKVLETLHDGDYYFNSCRTPWKYALNSIVNHTPIPTQVHLMNQWVKNKTQIKPNDIVSGYYIANGIPGTGFGSSGNLAFIAPFLVSAVAEKGNDVWIHELWKLLIETPIDACTFYENTLKLIALIIATGNWMCVNI